MEALRQHRVDAVQVYRPTSDSVADLPGMHKLWDSSECARAIVDLLAASEASRGVYSCLMDTPHQLTPGPWTLGVRAKIILPLVVMAVVASILGITLIHNAQSRQRERQLQDRASAITHAVVHMAETAADTTQLQRFVASMASESGVELIVVAVGEPLTVVASSHPEWLEQPVSVLPDPQHTRQCLETAHATRTGRLDPQHTENGTVDYSLPLRTRLRQVNALSWSLGAVMLHLDGSTIRRQQYADTARLIVMFLSAVGLSCLGSYFLLWCVVIRPIETVTRVARSTIAGTRQARVGWSRRDELGQIGTQFDHVLDELHRIEQQEAGSRQQADEARREAEEALAELRCIKLALDQHAIVAVTDSRGVITSVNDKFCEISKYSRDELIGKTHRVIHSDCHPRGFFRSMWQTIQRREVWRGEICNRAKDGTTYWVDTTVVPFTDSCGEIAQYVSIRTDITKRKVAEASLAAQERQFRTLVNSIPGVPYRCSCDEHWTMQFIGDAVQQLTGYPASDFIDNRVRSFSSVIHPEDRQRVFDTVGDAVGAGRPFSLEYRIVRADGEIRIVSEQGQLVCDDEQTDEGTDYLDGAIFDISAQKHAERELLEERARLAAFVEHAPAAIVMLDRGMQCVAVSRRFISDNRLEGRTMIGRPYYDSMPDTPQRWKDVYERGMRGEVTVCDEDILRSDGGQDDEYLRWEVRPWRLADGEIGGILIFTENITKVKRTEAALRESKEQFELAVRGSSDGIWDWNVQTGAVFYSQRYRELLGYAQSDAFPDRLESFERHLHPEDAPATLQALQEHIDHEVPYDVTFRLRTARGRWRWFRSRGEAVRGSDGRARRMAGSISDISSLKRVEEELTRAARLDRLTGLPNRGLFLDRLQQAIHRSDRARKHTYAVMFLDFDRFKIINDSLGHDVGDALLKEIADALRHNVGAADSLNANVSGHLSGRLGGDEFVVLLDELDGVADAEAMAARLLDAFAKPRQLGKHEVYTTASIGIVVGDASYARAEDVVRDADTAMYEAKRQGKARYVVFDASMRERVQRHLKLDGELRKAIGQPQLAMTYQPIVSLQTGLLYGVEALLRWTHPTEGVIEPTEFVPIAEESDLIMTLGEWGLEHSCRQMAAWQQTMHALAPKRMCINLSRKQFVLPDLRQRIERVLAATGVDPSRLQFEIREDGFAGDISTAVKTMHALKDLGSELAIDGFGSGSSSFASLHQFPVNVLKLDRSLLVGIEESNDVASMIHGLAVMVKNLGIDLVAEGVENPGQLIALQELGCDHAQGFFFAEGLTPEEIRAFFARSLSLDCQTRGAVAYANQWGERLAVFESFAGPEPTGSP